MRETGESSRGKKNKAFLAIKKEIEEKERQRKRVVSRHLVRTRATLSVNDYNIL